VTFGGKSEARISVEWGERGTMKRFDGSFRPLRVVCAVSLALSLAGPAMAASAAKTAPSTTSANSSTSQSNTSKAAVAHAYLMRGAFNIFSLGMDELAAKIERIGVSTTVTNYLSWSSLADEAVASYRAGRVKTIILIGHSSGATAVTEMANRLSQQGVPVKLAIGLDPTTRLAATGNVNRYINYYIAGGMGTPVDKGRSFNGTLTNVDLERDPGVGHFNIDKNQALQQRVISDIRSAL
jgi:hypothetical protein